MWLTTSPSSKSTDDQSRKLMFCTVTGKKKPFSWLLQTSPFTLMTTLLFQPKLGIPFFYFCKMKKQTWWDHDGGTGFIKWLLGWSAKTGSCSRPRTAQNSPPPLCCLWLPPMRKYWLSPSRTLALFSLVLPYSFHQPQMGVTLLGRYIFFKIYLSLFERYSL